MTLFKYLEWRKALKTIKGNIKELSMVSNNEAAFVQTFYIDDIKIEITTKESIKAKEGDFVIVAGVDGLDEIFKAYSFKNLN